MRKIYLSGDIDEESFKEFCEKLDELLLENPKKTIYLDLNSNGGVALSGIAFAERIRLSSAPIHITVYGQASSAAVLVLAAGKYRKMSKGSLVMVHEDQGSYKDLTTSRLAKEAANAGMIEEHWAVLLERFTGTASDVWRSMHAKGDLYLNPDECKELGLIDEII